MKKNCVLVFMLLFTSATIFGQTTDYIGKIAFMGQLVPIENFKETDLNINVYKK